MARDEIRTMKRQLRAGTAAQAVEAARQAAATAALGLLERSLHMGHRRLAVQRLRDAVALGVPLADRHWSYCRAAAAASRSADVQTLFLHCAQAATLRSPRRG